MRNEGAGDIPGVSADQDRSEDRETKAGSEVPRCLGDAGDLTVIPTRRAVDRVGAGGSKHQSKSATGKGDVQRLRAEGEVRQPPGEQPEANGAKSRATDDRELAPRLSRIRPPTWAMITNPRKNHMM